MAGGKTESKKSGASEERGQRPEEEERRLIQRAQAGDHGAFETLFQRYFGRVYRQASRLLGNSAEAEEVVQEVFLTVYKKVKTFRGDSAFSTWLYRIAANEAITRLQRRKKTEEVSMDEYLPSFQDDGHHQVRPVVDWSNDVESRIANKELNQILREAIDQLRPVERAALVLSELEGISNREIGEALGLSVPAVKSRLHRARLFLRGKLAVSLGHSPS